MITNLTIANFEQAIQSQDPILVDFWATWCAPCMMQGEVLHTVDKQHPSIQIGKVNVDENRELALRFGISAIPTMIVFQDGKAVETVTGLRQGDEILKLLHKHGADV